MIEVIKRYFANDILIELSKSNITVQRFTTGEKYQVEPFIAVEKRALESKQTDKLNVKAIGAEAKTLSSTNVTVSNPFEHCRSFVADFYLADEVIRHCVQQLHLSGFKPKPRIVMHQLEKVEGGLTSIEERVLLELAQGAGSRETVVYLGECINVKLETFEQVKAKVAISV